MEMRKKADKILKYKAHRAPAECCANCNNSEVTNPGANIPGLGCKLMWAMYKFADRNENGQVDKEGICNFYIKKG